MKVEAVIFDFDGTLINLDERELYAINKALASVGKPILSMHDFIEGYYLHPYTEVGSSNIIRRVLGGWDTSGKAVETYSNEFWNNPYLVKLQDETVNVLKALRDKRISLAIATFRKRRTIIEKEIHYLKIDGFVDALVTRQDIEWSPQERPTLGNIVALRTQQFAKGLALLQKEPSCTIIVGDAWWDIRAAKQTGAKSAWVKTGFGAHNDFSKEQPDMTLNKLEELLNHL